MTDPESDCLCMNKQEDFHILHQQCECKEFVYRMYLYRWDPNNNKEISGLFTDTHGMSYIPPPKKKINEPWYSIHNLKKNSGSTCGVSSKMRWWRNVEGTVHFNQWFEACIENEFWMPREYGTWVGTRSLHKEHTHFRWCQVQSTCLNILKLFWQFCLKRY